MAGVRPKIQESPLLFAHCVSMVVSAEPRRSCVSIGGDSVSSVVFDVGILSLPQPVHSVEVKQTH